MLALIALAKSQGMGVYDSGLVHTTYLAKLLVAYNDLWALTVSFTKASILMQYLRIFSGRSTRTACYTLLVLLVPMVCWAIFAGTFLCRPIRKLWYPELSGHCLHAQTYWTSVAALNITLDISVLILPLPAITSLRLPQKQKFAIVLVFLLGFMVCFISVIRLVLVVVTANASDYVQSCVWSMIWSTAEANVGITCASLLALKPLLVRLWPTLLHETDTYIPDHCMRLSTMEHHGLSPVRGCRGAGAAVLHSRQDSGVAGTALEAKFTTSDHGSSDRQSYTPRYDEPPGNARRLMSGQ
nr:hypothetical protein CFP56_30164 [Quercus suber]